MQKFHLCLSISGALRTWTKETFNKYYFGSVLHDNGNPMTHADAISMLRLNKAKGRKVLPIGKCDNFDYEHGCRGHEMEKEEPC